MLLLAISILSCPGEDGPFRKCVRAVAEDRRDVRLLYRDSSDGPYICCLPIFAAGRSESDMRCGTVWPSVGGFWCGIEYVDVSGKSTFQWNGPFFRFLLRLISLWLFHFNARHILISSYFILHLDRSIWFNWGKNDWSDIIKCSISSLFFLLWIRDFTIMTGLYMWDSDFAKTFMIFDLLFFHFLIQCGQVCWKQVYVDNMRSLNVNMISRRDWVFFFLVILMFSCA